MHRGSLLLWLLLAGLDTQALEISEDRGVMAAGSGIASAGPYAITDTIGQPAIGAATAVNRSLAAGFWHTLTPGTPLQIENRPPTAQPLALTRPPGVPIKILLADLAAQWSDPDGDPVELMAIAPVSVNNIPLFNNNTLLLYEAGPFPAQNVADAILYAIRDIPREGATPLMVLGTISIQVQWPGGLSCNIVGTEISPEGDARVTFAGIPGQIYLVQRATDLNPPIVWTTLLNNTDGTPHFVAGPNGLWTHTDLGSAAIPERYYRSALP
ncbi:MAG TPA: hypothetical protein PKM73_18660 [Verrucomicrobiota bacterium]|nr:hypothetical protein [Verrucomicrobiota bacterium]HNU51350.1 hypothetical protein [Verrucomicrobiota bacterium]